MPTCRIVVLISGNGSNLQAIIDYAQNQPLLNIVGVISDKASAYGLTRAQNAGISTTLITEQGVHFEPALTQALQHYQPDLIVLAGFMRILSAAFIEPFQGRILNIHPALLPHYKGLHTHQRVLAAGDREHGASVHFVTAELDGGPVVAQKKVPVLAQDDVKTLAHRVLMAEHELYSQCIEWFAQKRLTMQGSIAILDGQSLAPCGIPLGTTAQGMNR